MPKLTIDLEMRLAQFQDSLNVIQRSGEKTAHQLSSAFQGLNNVLGVLGVGVSIAGFTEFVNKTIDSADKIHELQLRTGATAQELLVLQSAAERGGVGIDGVSEVASKLSKRLEDARKGTGQAAEAFTAMGIKVEKEGGGLKNMSEILGEVGAKFRTYEEGANKAALATAALGRGGDRMIPMLELLDETQGRFERLGITIDEDFVAKAHDFDETLKDLSALIGVFSRQIVSELLPYMQQLAEVLVISTKNMTDFAGSVEAAIFPIKVMVTGVYTLYTGIAAAADALVGFVAASHYLGTGQILKAFDEMGIAGKKISDRFENATAVVSAFWQKTSDTSDANWEGPSSHTPVRGKAPGMPDLATMKAGFEALQKLRDEEDKLALTALKEQGTRETALLDDLHQNNLVGEQYYWDAKAQIQKTAFDAQLVVIDAELSRQAAALGKRATGSKEYYDAQKDLEVTLAQRNKLEADFQQVTTISYLAAQRAARQYTEEVKGLEAQLLELQGREEAAAKLRFELATRNIREKATINKDDKTLDLLDKLGRGTEDQAAFNKARQAQDDITARLQITEERLQNSQRTGAISELDAMQRTGAARLQAVAEMEQFVQKQEEIAKTDPNPKVALQAEQARAALEKLASEADLVGQKISTAFKDAFTDSFTDFVMGAKSAADAFKDFANSVIRELVRIQAQELATGLSKVLGFGSSAGAITGGGGLLSWIFGNRGGGTSALAAMAGNSGALEGALLGSYASGTDYVPRTGLALVHQGEQIIPAGGSGGVSIVQHIQIDSRSDLSSIAAAMRAAKDAAVREVSDARARGRA